MDILITNDDGVDAPGLRILADTLAQTGHRARVVCPARQQSGVGMRLTIFSPLHARPIRLSPSAIRGYVVDGSPADCVKLALLSLYNGFNPDDDFKPDLVVSGINPGANVGINVLYSGTVAAGLEATICGVPALAVSVESPVTVPPIDSEKNMSSSSSSPSPSSPPDNTLEDDIKYAAGLTVGLIDWLAKGSFRLGVSLLNCNIPRDARRRAKGFKFCRQGPSHFDDFYHYRGESEGGAHAFSLDGAMAYLSDNPNDDALNVREGWIALTLLGLQLNHESAPVLFSELSPPPLFDV